MNCPACGHAVSNPEARFCRMCGHDLSATVRHPCQQCNADNAPAAKFCRSCGASMTVAAGPADTKAVTETRDCPACHAGNPADRRFCKACGHNLSVPAPVVIVAAETLPDAPIAIEAMAAEDTLTEPAPAETTIQAPVMPEPATVFADKPLAAVPDEAPLATSVEASSNDPADAGQPPSGTTLTPLVSPPPQSKTVLMAGIAATVILAGGIGGYFWLWQAPPKATGQAVPAPISPVVSPPQAATPATPPAVTNDLIVQATPEPRTEPLPAPTNARPASAQAKPVVPPVQSTPLPPSQPASRPIANTTEPAPTPVPTPVERRAPPAPARQASSGGVPEEIERMCGKESGFGRKLCEEKVRLKLCNNQWGKIPGCPKYEKSEDGFQF
jgi:hypothetical protein